MDALTYDAVAKFCMVASLLFFMSLFLGILIYVFRVASRDGLEQAQRTALDLAPDSRKLKGQS